MISAYFEKLAWQNYNHFLLGIALLGLSILISLGEQSEHLISRVLPFLLICLGLLMANTHNRNQVSVAQPFAPYAAKLAFLGLFACAILAFLYQLLA